MTVINFKIDEESKRQIEEIAKLRGYKSISEFIREAIEDKMNLQKIIANFAEKNPPLDVNTIKIPDFIPDGKYLGISRNTIVSMGDSIQEVMNELFDKFPESAAGIIRKGKDIEKFEVLFSFFAAEKTRCYQQVEISNSFYPILRFSIEINGESKPMLGLIDTGASIISIDKDFVKGLKLEPIVNKDVLTANGIVNLPIFKSIFKYENNKQELEFTLSDLSGPLPIKALIGKNFIDMFNLLLLGKEKLFCLQML